MIFAIFIWLLFGDGRKTTTGQKLAVIIPLLCMDALQTFFVVWLLSE